MMSIFPKLVFSFYCVTEGASIFAQTSWPNTCPEGGCQGFFRVFQETPLQDCGSERNHGC
jgi:hypothetical protein